MCLPLLLNQKQNLVKYSDLQAQNHTIVVFAMSFQSSPQIIEMLITDYMQLLLFFQRNSMANIFYFNSVLYTPFQVDPTVFCTPNTDNGYIILPYLHSNPSLMEFHNQTLCTKVLTTTQAENAIKEPIESILQKKSKKSIRSSKNRKQAINLQDDSQEFKVKEIKTGTGVTYKKKNTQSNIVNQTFSYLSSQRSRNMVKAFFQGDQVRTDEYYRIMTKVKQINKKYINRIYLKRLIEFSQTTEFYRAFVKSKINIITLEEVQRLLRCLTYRFLREGSVLTFLTSTKIYKETFPEHFWRKREIARFLFEKNSKIEDLQLVQ